MQRREFITLVGGAAAAWPLAARAQQAGKLPIIGFLGQSTTLGESERAAKFAQRLRELGWIEGQTVAIEYRWAEGRSERLAEIAAEFVSGSAKFPDWESWKTLASVTAYHSFAGEVEALNTPTIRRLTPSCRHQLPPIAREENS
jgi:hypothetical protein